MNHGCSAASLAGHIQALEYLYIFTWQMHVINQSKLKTTCCNLIGCDTQLAKIYILQTSYGAGHALLAFVDRTNTLKAEPLNPALWLSLRPYLKMLSA